MTDPEIRRILERLADLERERDQVVRLLEVVEKDLDMLRRRLGVHVREHGA